MSIFEIDLNPEFKLLNCHVFLDEADFAKYYKLNNLSDNDFDKKEFLKYISIENITKFAENSLFGKRHSFDTKENSTKKIEEFIGVAINAISHDENPIALYPEWQLFYISIKKIDALSDLGASFSPYIYGFDFISEIRYKKYIIRNLHNFLPIGTSRAEIIKLQNLFESCLNSYIVEHQIESAYLIDFLKFLSEFHRQLVRIEKYKIAWNIETYIAEALYYLIRRDFDLTAVYKTVGGGAYSELHKAIIYKPLYIDESLQYFRSHMPLITKLFECSEDSFKKTILNTRYEDILYTYIEANKRFGSNKRSDIVLGALIKAIVLEVEVLIKDTVDCVEDGLFECLKKLKSGSYEFKRIQKLIKNKDCDSEFFGKFKKLIKEEKDSLEKYLMIYYHSRNYLAHNNTDIDYLLEEENGKRVVGHILDSVIVTLHTLETYFKAPSNENKI